MPNEFGLTLYSTADGTRPAAAFGVAVTPGNNAYGSYATLISGASLTDDVYEIWICVNNAGIAASARDCVVSIGLDPAGGTSFTSIVDLVCGPAAPYQETSTQLAGGGVTFLFPLFIKAGTSIGAAAAVNSATLNAISVCCQCKARPSRPDLLWVGTHIDQFGVTLASSNGTAITPGTTSEGTYLLLGTLAKSCGYLEFGYGVNSATMTNNAINVDIAIGDGTNFKNVVCNAPVVTNSAEEIMKRADFRGYCNGAVGDKIYARAQVGPNAADANNSIAVYAVGA